MDVRTDYCLIGRNSARRFAGNESLRRRRRRRRRKSLSFTTCVSAPLFTACCNIKIIAIENVILD